MGPLSLVNKRARWLTICLAVLAIGLLGSLPPLLSWQTTNERRTRSLSNVRRLALALQLYAQDYDDRLMPPATPLGAGRWLTWPQQGAPYGVTDSLLNNPSNPLSAVPGPVIDRDYGCHVRTGYALNHRFNDTFGHGPFMLDNLELPGQTALLVEAGPMWSQTGRKPGTPSTPHPYAALAYRDTEDRFENLVPYPSTHEGRLVVAAADGHAATVRVEHYGPDDGPHDPLYGRIGADLYNWNGGHPNGELDRPPHE
jgi:type II secretory pathway pseudopilin PulG